MLHARGGRQRRAVLFADALRDQGAPVVEVDWRPPAGGDPAPCALLTALWGGHGERDRGRATREAVARDRGLARRGRVTVAPRGRRRRRAARRPAAALRAADRVGARLRPAAPRADRRVPVRGLGADRDAAAAAAGARRDRAGARATSTATSGR